jgi:hypothetical protein
MTAAQRDAIPSPPQGLIVYCTNCGANGELQIFNGATYTNLIGGTRQASTSPPSLGGQSGTDINGEAINDESGTSVSISSDGSVLAIGAPKNSGNGTLRGHVRIYAWNGSAWAQRGSDIDGGTNNEQSGYSVSLSSDGSVIAIGARLNSANQTLSGKVRVYRWDGTSWVQRGSDISGPNTNYSYFGTSVSLSSNGDVLAIGASGGNSTISPTNTTGLVQVYTWSGTAWVQRGSNMTGTSAGDYFGYSVSLSANGNLLAVSAPWGAGTKGQVKVYDWGGSTWNLRGAAIDGEATGDYSGKSVSLSSDGTVLAIGADANSNSISVSGHVRVYAWNSTSLTWNQRGSDIDGLVAGEEFGISVSLSSDGAVLAAGAPNHNSQTGRVRVHYWNGTSWVQVGSSINGEAVSDKSGGSVSLSANGSVLAIGANLNDGNGSNSGHVRTFLISR